MSEVSTLLRSGLALPSSLERREFPTQIHEWLPIGPHISRFDLTDHDPVVPHFDRRHSNADTGPAHGCSFWEVLF